MSFQACWHSEDATTSLGDQNFRIWYCFIGVWPCFGVSLHFFLPLGTRIFALSLYFRSIWLVLWLYRSLKLNLPWRLRVLRLLKLDWIHFLFQDGHNLWGPGSECYGLKIKCDAICLILAVQLVTLLQGVLKPSEQKWVTCGGPWRWYLLLVLAKAFCLLIFQIMDKLYCSFCCHTMNCFAMPSALCYMVSVMMDFTLWNCEKTNLLNLKSACRFIVAPFTMVNK